MFVFNWLGIIWRGGVHLKLVVQGQGGGRILYVIRQGGGGEGGFENWTIFMDVICVSSLITQVFNVLVVSLCYSVIRNQHLVAGHCPAAS